MKYFIRTATLVVALCLSQLFVAGQKQFKTAIDLNDYLASITDTLYNDGVKWGEAFSKANANKNFSTLSVPRKKLESFIQRKQLEVLLMKDINGSENLRLSMLEFLFFEAKMAAEAFLPLEKLNSQSTDDEIKRAITSLTDMAKEENKYLEKVVAAQEAYGKKNGFTIEAEKKGGY